MRRRTSFLIDHGSRAVPLLWSLNCLNLPLSMSTCSLSSSLFSFQSLIFIFIWILFRLNHGDIVIKSQFIVFNTFFLNLVFIWAVSSNAKLTNLRATLEWELRDGDWLLRREVVLLFGVLGVVHLVCFGSTLSLMGLKILVKPSI